MINTRNLMVCLLAASLFTACSPTESKKSDNDSIDTNKITGSSILTPEEKAEQLALAGEQLLTPVSFMYADLVFDQALSFNKNNTRANFYKSFLAPAMTTKGSLTRIKSLATRNPKSKEQYEKAISNLPNSGLKTFLLDGSDDLKSEKNIQNFLSDFVKAQDQFRLYLKNNKDLELTLNVPSALMGPAINEAYRNCQIERVSEGVYTKKNCDLTHALEVKLNRADAEDLQNITAGYQIYTLFAINYDVSGAIAVADKYEGKRVSNKTVWNELIKNQDFGKVRDMQNLKPIVDMGLDAVAGVRWAVSIQDQLCPSGAPYPTNRPGYLFKEGICIKEYADDGTPVETVLKIVELGLAGNRIEFSYGKDKEYTASSKPAALFDNNIQDLKLLTPKFNKCDKVAWVADDTLGGVFPDKDGNFALFTSAQCNN